MFGFKADPFIVELAAVPLLSTCTRAELRSLASLSTVIDVPVGATLCREGEAGREVFIVLDGATEIIVGGEIIAEVGAGEILGEVAVFNNGPRTADAVVTEAARVLVMSRREFDTLVSKSPKFARLFTSAMARRVREVAAV